MNKTIEEVRESIAFYGENNTQAVDFINVIIGKTLPQSTQNALGKLTLIEVSNLTKEDLLDLEGIGKVAAERVEASIGLAKSLRADRFQKQEVVTSYIVAMRLFNHLRDLDQEHVDVAFLDTKKKVISVRNIFKGTLNSSIIHPREIFKQAVKLSAASIVVGRNHPSGSTRPSDADLAMTERLRLAGEVMGVPLVDHIIVGNESMSMKSEGYLE